MTLSSDQPTVYVALDLETTGLAPDTDEIIEVGAVKFDRQGSVERFSTLVNPYRPLTPFIESFTGITTQEVAQAPGFAVVASDLERFIGMAPVVGHSISFDLSFLDRKGIRPHGPSYDTLDLASVLRPTIPSYSLSQVAHVLGVKHPNAHRAAADAETTMLVFLHLLDELASLPLHVQQALRRLADGSDWSLRFLFREVIPEPTGAAEGAEIGLEGVNAGILQQRLSQGGGGLPPGHGEAVTAPEDEARVFAPGGALSNVLEGYEPRDEQTQMAAAVAKALDDGQRLIVEAGTGTGKSLAYLIPSARFAHRTGQRVVLSTNTINLQEQLIAKDIPTALQALETGGAFAASDVKYSLLKGRGNYLCLRRWAALGKGLSLTAMEARTAAKILIWLQSTATGDRNELNLIGPESGIWPRLSAQGLDDQTGLCTFARRGMCFYQAARRRADGAHLVVVNHALLALDAVHDGLLPEYRHLIIDEAHNLEEVVTNQWGTVVDEDALDALLDRVSGSGSGGVGMMTPLSSLARSLTLGAARRQDLSAIVDEVQANVLETRRQAAVLFHHLAEFVQRHAKGSGGYSSTLRLTSSTRAQPAWSKIEVQWEDVNVLLVKLARQVDQMGSAAQRLSDTEFPDREDYLVEAASVSERCAELREGLRAAIAHPDAEGIYWISVGARDADARLNVAPLQVGPLLNRRLFDAMDSVVLTGATLSTEGNLEYLKERLQISDPQELVLGSPFDYPRAVLAYVPQDMPEPNAPAYQAALQKIIVEAARAAGGRMLVLFTAWGPLRTARRRLPEALAPYNIEVMAQGVDGTPAQLVRRLMDDPSRVVLGTGSFWEGVDIPGDALSVLVITRLPFSVPSDPVFAARSDQFEDGFNSYTVPQAVLRFKQGFGRLIRRKTDRGVLLVLDRRIVARNYGAAFWDSIPPVTRKVGPTSDLFNAVSHWLGQERLPTSP